MKVHSNGITGSSGSRLAEELARRGTLRKPALRAIADCYESWFSVPCGVSSRILNTGFEPRERLHSMPYSPCSALALDRPLRACHQIVAIRECSFHGSKQADGLCHRLLGSRRRAATSRPAIVASAIGCRRMNGFFQMISMSIITVCP